jgi:hypothetical protein
MPDPQILADLEDRIAAHERKLVAMREALSQLDGAPRLRLQHRAFALEREQLEYKLSLLLNRRKLAQQGTANASRLSYLFEPDSEIAEVGLRLNRLRIKRRIYDYVVRALQDTGEQP